MKFTILTLFPELFELYLNQTIIQRAVQTGIVKYDIVNIREFSGNKHAQVDDTPFGGGAGMVLKPEPYWNYFKKQKEEKRENPFVIFVTPQGIPVDQNIITDIAKKEDVVIISGRYEGLDQRVIDNFVDMEISIADFVLSSGDLPALCLMDSVIRIKDGVIKKESFETDSFYNGLLGFPQYTKPAEIDGMSVPEVLVSGHHKKIDEYRLLESLRKTYKNRPDLLRKKLAKDEEFFKIWEKYKKEIEE